MMYLTFLMSMPALYFSERAVRYLKSRGMNFVSLFPLLLVIFFGVCFFLHLPLNLPSFLFFLSMFQAALRRLGV